MLGAARQQGAEVLPHGGAALLAVPVASPTVQAGARRDPQEAREEDHPLGEVLRPSPRRSRRAREDAENGQGAPPLRAPVPEAGAPGARPADHEEPAPRRGHSPSRLPLRYVRPRARARVPRAGGGRGLRDDSASRDLLPPKLAGGRGAFVGVHGADSRSAPAAVLHPGNRRSLAALGDAAAHKLPPPGPPEQVRAPDGAPRPAADARVRHWRRAVRGRLLLRGSFAIGAVQSRADADVPGAVQHRPQRAGVCAGRKQSPDLRRVRGGPAPAQSAGRFENRVHRAQGDCCAAHVRAMAENVLSGGAAEGPRRRGEHAPGKRHHRGRRDLERVEDCGGQRRRLGYGHEEVAQARRHLEGRSRHLRSLAPARKRVRSAV
mmetsp:Transcript_8053/g.30238  ORF Transcript_8053/g.30238 Transcript_8053/m.30238 type:complete len:377 (-) Transcript_8053:3122-4252(-)